MKKLGHILPLGMALGWCAAPGASAQIVKDDPQIHEYTLRNASGMTVRFLDYGATITSIEVPDRAGHFDNVVLGYGSAADYRAKNEKNRFGAVVGRYAGRIAGATFSIGGVVSRLTPNDGPNALHGGGKPGLDSRIWQVKEFHEKGAVGARLTVTSPDGDQGFPGALTVTVTYRLSADNNLRIDYSARTTRPTVLNLTNHSYFNLAGAGSGSVEKQTLEIDASRWVETDQAGIPTGRFPAVAGTPLDFRMSRPIGERIDAKQPMMASRGGYNHAWLLARANRHVPARAATLSDPASGRLLRIETSEPSLQAYTGDYIDGQDKDARGRTIHPRDGIALETQHLSDSPHHPTFPSTLLRPGETWRSTTLWHFGLMAGAEIHGRRVTAGQ
ncbi:galactose mutarotase [Sphingomonas oligophenolica]|uniref:Aldose 1-epimerase n=1 Tax=Sphingomonas oligophenolica TaxID=301154 RepID=A0ABU9Y4G1_9SPHN